MKVKQIFYTLLMPWIKLYWKIFKPKSYGVKVVITHPDDKNTVLLVRHSYGNTTLWNIPGGGYNPKKEDVESAARREILEELGVNVVNLQLLGEYQTGGEGKKDIVTMYSGTLKTDEEMKLNSEILELSWVNIHTISIRGEDVARVARRAVEKIIAMRN